ncbi:MAG: ATPase [Candidatus Chisholmbacteria bacterium]|nr:ATPase [Candidatus Chisholmbacteria bacterium]
MALRAIREFDAKRLIGMKGKRVLVGPGTRLRPFDFAQGKWVVKPDELVGKRSKHGLVGVNLDEAGVKEYLDEYRGKEVEISGVKDRLEYFLVEPYVEHIEEWLVAMRTRAEGDEILWSEEGGVEVEEKGAVETMVVPVGGEFKGKWPIPYIEELYKVFVRLDFGGLEINPLARVGDEFIPLDVKARLDDAARFWHLKDWEAIEFPSPWGRRKLKEEDEVAGLDEKSGASLKLTVINPLGRIWLLVAGGAGSVVYADTVADLGQAEELANYGEYSGNPSTEEMYQYTKAVVGVMVREGKRVVGKKLLVGGAVANFTDVAATFKGMVRAMREMAEELGQQKVEILVRRGGPNYQEGLAMMNDFGREFGVAVRTFGPERPMTEIVELALR